MARQWNRDLAHALATGLIPPQQHDQIGRTIELKRERLRLRRLSASGAPWKLWFASASRILGVSRRSRIFRKSLRKIIRDDLTMRLSGKKRDEYWSRFIS
jgi:hypothetical protein